MTTDYHQKPIDSMTPGEKRAYRRKLARAALKGCSANVDFTPKDFPELAQLIYDQADAVIEHERREEQGET